MTYYGALTKYGTDIPLAACGIVMKTNAIILAIVVGISQGTQPIIGFNYGARQYHRVREAYLNRKIQYAKYFTRLDFLSKLAYNLSHSI